MSSISGFETLEVWKEARKLKIKIYSLLKRYPAEEKYELVLQTRRAIRSVTAISLRDMVDFIIKKMYHFVENQEAHFQKSLIISWMRLIPVI